jgi:hypothetical protein
MPATATNESIQLREEAAFSDHRNIDRANAVIRDVKPLGRYSANGREYSDQSMSDATRLYEGVEVFFDHDRENPRRERRVLESIGVLRNPYRKGDAVYANLHYLASHPDTPTMLERINRGMRIGLSHNAEGKSRREGGKTIIESLSRVHSVDLVLNPATNSGLFESREATGDYPRTQAEFVAAASSGRYSSRSEPRSFKRLLEEQSETGREVRKQSAEVDSAVVAALGELLPADTIEQVSKMGCKSIERAYQTAIAFAAKLPDASAAKVKAVLGKLLDEQRKAIATFESILSPLDTYDPPAMDAGGQPTVESVWRELQAKRGEGYPRDLKEMAARLR